MKKLFLLLITVLTISLYASAQTRTITGTVVDADSSEPLVGVSVVPVGSAGGTTTDIDGYFRLAVDSKVKELTISYVGYTTQTVKAEPQISVALHPANEMLETLVVTGYGSGKKLGSLTGSVSVVGSAQLENVTTPSFVDALQGQVAGLSVMSNSGDPSSMETQIRLRGLNTLYLSNDPLFILDGSPITQTVFNTINSNDIESITVLKDAASVAIYGSRAANGVIVITSKKGKYADQAHVSIRAKYGFSQLNRDGVEMMNSAQYIKFRDLINTPVTDEMRYAAEVLGIDTNWRDETFDAHAPTYSLEGAITGGTENINYYLSLNHMDMQGIVAQSAMRRETVRVSLAARLREWLRVGFQANLGYTKYQKNNESETAYDNTNNQVYLTNPMTFARVALPMDATRYWVPKGVVDSWSTYKDGVTFDNKDKYVDYLHFTQLGTPWYNEKCRSVWRNRVTVNANIFEEIRPIKDLLLRASQGVDAYDYRINNIGWAHEYLITPMGDVYGAGNANEAGMISGYSQQNFSRYYAFTYTNTAEYRHRFGGDHNLTVLLGEESIIQKSEGFGSITTGQIDPRLYLLQNATSAEPRNQTQSISEVAMNSIFISGSYNFQDKYFFDANYRRDGSSKFAPRHRWASFFSVGAMWDAKQEKFMQPLTWLDAARLRVSYGTTGNSSVANYAYFGLAGAGGNYKGQGSIAVATPSNNDLTWETVKGLDLGLNLGFINMFNVDVAFYDKRTVNMIMGIPYSATTGSGGTLGNVGTMSNIGVDVDLTAKLIQDRDWYWDIHGNFNYNDNKVVKLYDDLDELVLANSGIILKEGKKAMDYYMVRFAGVDPRDGKQMWYTKEGNLTKVYNEERDAVGMNKTQFAPFAGGFGTSLSWKGLSLRADFTWALGKYMINNDLYFIENSQFGTTYNQTTKMLDIWTHPGQITDIPAFGEALQIDSRYLEDASFLRLKTLTLQYSFPKNILRKANLSDLKLHFTGRNLLTFTGYTGYDPEPESNVVSFYYPNTRQYEFGFDISF